MVFPEKQFSLRHTTVEHSNTLNSTISTWVCIFLSFSQIQKSLSRVPEKPMRGRNVIITEEKGDGSSWLLSICVNVSGRE